MKENRNYQMDFARLLFATLVILSHAFEYTDGNRSRELLCRLTHAYTSFGELAVDGFFLLSGFLIAKSWEHDPNFPRYLRKRVLRIVPGYLIAAVASVCVVGYLAPGVNHFFRDLNLATLGSILTLGVPSTPPVLPGLRYASVNGAMWSIPYEFRSYMFVALLGILGLLRRRVVLLSITAFLWLCFTVAAIGLHFYWHGPVPDFLVGEADYAYRLYSTYMIGTCFFVFRDEIKFRIPYAIVAIAALVLVSKFLPHHFENALVTCGAYLLFYAMQARTTGLRFMRHVPDISYGVYLYGHPVESLWIWFHHGSPWITFFFTTGVSIILGWLSWHFVERPALKLKKRPTVILSAP